MRRASWMAAAVAALAAIGGAAEAKAQWAEVSTVRYGLFGRPRAIETHLVPTVGVLPTTTVVTSSELLGVPVATSRVVRTLPTEVVVPSRSVVVDPGVVTTTYVAPALPITSTGVVVGSPVVRSYAVPTVRVVEPTYYILP